MARNAEETRRKILVAATEEFAQHGIAGARVDRVTTTAGVNNALLYRYFGSKLDLFDTVYTSLIENTVDAVPFDADDLPRYIGELCDYYVGHPEVVRLTAWRQLERPDRPLLAVVGESVADEIEKIAAAQKAGIVADRVAPGELLAVIVHLSLINTVLSPVLGFPGDRDRRRDAIVEAVRAVIRP